MLFDYAVEGLVAGEVSDVVAVTRQCYGWTLTARLPGRKRLIVDLIKGSHRTWKESRAPEFQGD